MSLHTRKVLRKALRSVRRTMIRWGWRLDSCGTGPRTGEAKAGRLGRCQGRVFCSEQELTNLIAHANPHWIRRCAGVAVLGNDLT